MILIMVCVCVILLSSVYNDSDADIDARQHFDRIFNDFKDKYGYKFERVLDAVSAELNA